jgi:site-specific recombinase XerD
MNDTTALIPTASLDIETWHAWLAGQRSANTQRNYAVDLHTAMTYFAVAGIQSFAQLDTRDGLDALIRYPHWLRDQGYANSTIARKISALRQACEYAVAAHLLSSNPTRTIKAFHVSDVSPRMPLSIAEVRALLDAPSKRTIGGLRDRAMLTVLAYLGLRAAEMCAMRLGDFAWNGDYLVLRVHGKREKVRELPARPVVIEALRSYLAADGRPTDDRFVVASDRAHEWVFPPFNDHRSPGGNGITTQGLRKLVHRYADRAGIKTDVHTLRMTAATQAHEGGADVMAIKEFLGHSSVTTTQRYIKRRDLLRDSAANQVHYG